MTIKTLQLGAQLYVLTEGQAVSIAGWQRKEVSQVAGIKEWTGKAEGRSVHEIFDK